ncbi:MAG TPA: nucleoside hydrolase [Terracidiphilus sp.]|jgi:purine nucleosidase|nr:nucleoside hydrolase [Terracidiphilus sp.]
MKIHRSLPALLVGFALCVGLQRNALTQAPATPQLVILDTDIGDDIDDAFALALALQSPELKILGVTTTFGNTELRARLVDRYLTAVGRGDLPIAAGPATPATNNFTQAAYAKRVPESVHADAIEFLFSQIRKHPGEITLIAIGPLSNVHAAIERDPETFKKLKRVVLMGGSVNRGYDGSDGARRPAEPEWNFLCDPAGAKALFGSGVPVFMMPLDSTQVHLPREEREKIFAHGSPLTDQLTLLYHQWAAGSDNPSPSPTLFDPVAVTYTFRPDLCPATPMRIEIDDSGLSRQVNGTPNAQVCLQSDEKGFLQFLLDRVTAK